MNFDDEDIDIIELRLVRSIDSRMKHAASLTGGSPGASWKQDVFITRS